MTFRPRGDLPPRVYWRRRTAVVGLPVVALVVLTSFVSCRPSGGAAGTAAAPGSSAGPSGSTGPSAAGSARPSGAGTSTPAAGSGGPPGSAAAGPSGTSAATCAPGDLAVAAATAASSFAAGSEPVLYLQVTDTGSAPCGADLADPQVELQVYSGGTRVWGSHDCEVAPGTTVQTLLPGRAVRVAVTWSGLSSQPGCAGTRTRVPAGTYTLHALLGGRPGTPVPFTLT